MGGGARGLEKDPAPQIPCQRPSCRRHGGWGWLIERRTEMNRGESSACRVESLRTPYIKSDHHRALYGVVECGHTFAVDYF